MAERYNGFTVILSEDVSEEYMGRVKSAVGLISGVLDIHPHTLDLSEQYITRTQTLIDVLNTVRTKLESPTP